MPKIITITHGDTFNQLVYLHDVQRIKSNVRRSLFLCKACNNTVERDLGNVRSGRVKTCGCKQFTDQTKHGQARQSGLTTLYKRWKGIRQRCNNPNFKQYHQYGGRGIKVCKEWNDFSVFAEWAESNGFDKSLEIERKNNDLGYSPDNCTWATKLTQMANRNKTPNTKFKYIGTHQLPGGNWRTSICVNYKIIDLGVFLTEKEAVIRRDNYIIKHKLPHKLNNL